jgi:TrmH family RNA methyltransferase
VAELGFHNELVRAARALQQKKHRQEQRCFLIEGAELLGAALAAHAKIERVFAIRDALTPALLGDLQHTGIEPDFVDRRTIESLSQTKAPQGVVAVARLLHHQADELGEILPPSEACLVLVLPDLSDPGNAGTLLRTAEAFGAQAACFGSHAVDPYNDKVVRASMGSVFRLPLVVFENWEDFADRLRSARVTIVGAAPDGADVRSVTLPPRAAVVVGQERHGLAHLPASGIELLVSIPHAPAVDSLNAAVAGALVLYEFGRAYGGARPPAAGTSPGKKSSP